MTKKDTNAQHLSIHAEYLYVNLGSVDTTGSIQNKTGAVILYINKLAYVSTAAANCDTATDLYTSGQTSGAYVTPITLQKN